MKEKMTTLQANTFDINNAIVNVTVRFPFKKAVPSNKIHLLQKYLYKNIVLHRKINNQKSGEYIEVSNKTVALTGKSFWIDYSFSSCQSAIQESASVSILIEACLNKWEAEAHL